MKFRCLALSGLLAFSAAALAGADPASDAARHIRAGDYSAAAERLRRAAPFAKEQIQERFLYATALAGAGERAAAAELFEGLIADYPDYPEPYNNLAALYAAEGQLEKARDVLEHAIRTDDRYAAIYGNLSAVYVEMARASYVKALRLEETPNAPNLRVLEAMTAPTAKAETLVADARPVATPTDEPAPVRTPEPAAVKPAPPPAAEPPTIAAAPAAQASRPAPVVEQPTPAVEKTAPVAVPPVEPAANETPANATAPVAAPQPAAPSGASAEVDAMLAAWAKAWASQDVEAYLGFYAADFTPPRGASRPDWEAERRERLARPGSIEVTLEDVQVRLRGPDAATVRVVQGYRSPGYQDRTRKAFSLVRRDGQWLIASERTLQVLP